MATDRELLEIALLSIGVIALSVLIYVFQKNGMFDRIDPKKKKIGPFIIAYTTHVGPYESVGPLFRQMSQICQTESIVEKPAGSSDREEVRAGETMGVFFDDPKKTEKDRLRALVGIVLDAGKGVNEERRNRWATKMKDNDSIKGVEILHAAENLVVAFPFYGMLSIFIGVKRVYSKLQKTMKKEGIVDKGKGVLPCGSIEFYSCEKNRTLFCAPLKERKTLKPFELEKNK